MAHVGEVVRDEAKPLVSARDGLQNLRVIVFAGHTDYTASDILVLQNSPYVRFIKTGKSAGNRTEAATGTRRYPAIGIRSPSHL